MDDLIHLEQEYCPPIDSALFSAIISDFNLSDPEHVAQARETLESIKAAALEEENTSFDPSGTSAQNESLLDHDTARPASNAGSWPLESETTETTSLSNGMHSLSVNSDPQSYENVLAHHAEEMEQLDLPTKKSLLMEMFPSVSAYTVEHTLQKCSGKWDRAMDELLNQALLNGEESIEGEEKVYAKGIEAFSNETNGTPRGRKKKNKRRIDNLNNFDGDARSSSTPAPVNKWDSGRRDIEFLSARISVSAGVISSVYYQQGASLPATLIALADSPMPEVKDKQVAPDDAISQVNAYELGREFPSVPVTVLTSLIRLTYPSTASAHELAKVVAQSTVKGGLQVIPTYAPPSLSEDQPEPFSASTTWTSVPSTRRPSPLGSSTSSPNPSAMASYYSHLHRRALSQARDAATSSRSQGNKRYMTAAAAYYSQQSREWARASAAASSAAADAHVASSSMRADEVDLHGVTVKDGVRIALEKTREWWHRTGGARVKGLDGRVVSEAGYGNAKHFSIVTGIGRHSEGGKGKLTPAVERALLHDGWNAVAMEGVVTVHGKTRR